MAVITSLGVPDAAGNTTTIMPKLAYRFRVTFIGEAFSATPTRSVVAASRPSLQHDQIPIDAYNSRIYLAGKHQWGDVQITLRDDVDSQVIREINNQLNRQVDHAAQSAPRAGAAYKFQTVVETLDGGNPDPGILDRYELAGCYISSVSYGDLNYGASDQITISIGIRYDNAEIYDAAGNATLSGIEQDQTLSNASGAGTPA
jgi:hypothetical protein